MGPIPPAGSWPAVVAGRPEAAEAEPEPFAVISLGLAVLGLLTVWFGVGLLPALAALPAASVARRRIARSAEPRTGAGLARAAVIVALVTVAAFAVLLAIALARWRGR